MSLSNLAYSHIVRYALVEDIGSGDITTNATIPGSKLAVALLLAKSPLVLCGIDVARSAFLQVDESLKFEQLVADGAALSGKREKIAVITGSAASILTAERVALNFLQRLSGVATLSAAFVRAVAVTDARIVDTRKTTPGLRVLEKYAVTVGGAFNHRFGLSDGVLIKDNHIVAAGGISNAVEAARKLAPHTLKIEVEVKHVGQIDDALAAGADIIMLDNMSNRDLITCVNRIKGRALTEASGGVNLSTVSEIAKTGVDLISVGALTHSAPASDICLDFVSESVK
jgi:nicotinate-nucleotide pyrophosphorylase (carboxylating)